MPLPVPSKKCSVPDSVLRSSLMCHTAVLLAVQLLMAMLWEDVCQIIRLIKRSFRPLLLPAARCMAI